MEYVRAAEFSFTKDQLAVAVTKGAFGSHVGIVFHSAQEGVRLLHLASHLRLLSDDFSSPSSSAYVAAVVKIPPVASKTMVAIVRSVAKRQPRIEYGINVKSALGSFDSSGRYKAPKGSDGLTCATFVSTIFHDCRIPLIQLETWEPQPENELWGRQVCQFLREQRVDEEHVKAVEKNISGLRVRPEEVAAAAHCPVSAKPLDYTAAKAGVPSVLAALQSISH